MIKKFKVMISKLIWKVAGISPKMGNLVMDILGDDNYAKVMNYANVNEFE